MPEARYQVLGLSFRQIIREAADTIFARAYFTERPQTALENEMAAFFREKSDFPKKISFTQICSKPQYIAVTGRSGAFYAKLAPPSDVALTAQTDP